MTITPALHRIQHFYVSSVCDVTDVKLKMTVSSHQNNEHFHIWRLISSSKSFFSIRRIRTKIWQFYGKSCHFSSKSGAPKTNLLGKTIYAKYLAVEPSLQKVMQKQSVSEYKGFSAYKYVFIRLYPTIF